MKLKSNLKKIKDCRFKLDITIEAPDVDSRYREVLQSFGREARLPGFRPGKAPVDLVEKKYSREAEEETIKSIVPEAFHQAVASHEVAPVSLPTITDVQYKTGQKISFSAEFDSAPEVTLKHYKGIPLKKIPSGVSSEDIEKGLTSLLESRAELVPIVEPREVRAKDFVVSDVEIWQDGKYVPGKKGVLLYAEPSETDDFYDKILGAHVDEVREVSVDMNEEEKKQGLVGRKPFYKIWVRGIQEKKLPELSDEFAKQFGKGTVDELREAVRKDLAHYKLGESHNQMKEELFTKLLAQASFPLPESLVEKQKERLVEQAQKQVARMGLPPEKLEAELASIKDEAAKKAAEQVKLYFILQKVAELEEITIDEMELEQKLNALAEESKRPVEEVRRVFEDDLRESLLEKKTIDFLLANAKFEENK